MTNNFKINSISRMTIDYLFMQLFLYTSAFSMVFINEKIVDIKHFWEVSKYFPLSGFVFCVITFLVGIFFRQARIVHIIFPITVSLAIAPLLLAIYELNEKKYNKFFIVIILCLVNIVLSYRSTLSNLFSNNTPAIKSGRLNIENSLWDLNKHLIIDKNRDVYKTISNILIPLGTITGSFLSRNFQGYSAIMAIGFGFFFSIVISGTIGIHIAASKYIAFIEKKYGKHINIK